MPGAGARLRPVPRSRGEPVLAARPVRHAKRLSVHSARTCSAFGGSLAAAAVFNDTMRDRRPKGRRDHTAGAAAKGRATARIDGETSRMAREIEITPEVAEYRRRVAETPYFSGNLVIEDEVALSSGEVLSGIVVAYDTWGTLNEDKSNVILVEHALSGNSHVADAYRKGEFREGWWNRVVGPGKAIDTDRYFVICSNVLGGCSGTTGPSSPRPGSDEPYGMSFPVVTVKDMVMVQRKMLELLGIDRVEAVIGGSLGGMQALVWAKKFPQVVKRCIAIATTWRTSAQSIAFNEVGRRAIITDPLFKDGRYEKDNPPAHGLAIARMIGHITYLSEASMNRKFGRQLVGDKLDFTMGREFQVESYLDHQGYKFVDRFDARSYLYITRAIDYFSLCHSTEAVTTRFKDSPVKFLLLSYDSDWLFPTEQMNELLNALTVAGVDVTAAEISLPFGHDSFLLDSGAICRYIAAFLREGDGDGGR